MAPGQLHIIEAEAARRWRRLGLVGPHDDSRHSHMSSLHDPWQDAAPIWTPAKLPNLALWLRADLGITLNGSKVSAWADQSGNANNFSQANGANQPTFTASDATLGNKPSVSNATKDANITMSNSTLSLAQPWTLWSVTYTSDTTENTNVATGSNSFAVFSGTGTTWFIHAVNGANRLSCGSSAGAASILLYEMNVANATTRMALNSASVFSTLTTYNSTAATASLVLFSSTTPIVGAIAEFGFVTGIMSAANERNLVNYLGARYGISVT